MRSPVSCPRLPWILVGLAPLVCPSPARAQHHADSARAPLDALDPVAALPECFRLLGLVVDEGGAPLEGAVVSSNAGGLAVVDARGRYDLEVEVPRLVERLQIVAQAPGALTLSRSCEVRLPADPSEAPGPVLVPTLQLSQDAGGEPAWIATFGSQPGVSSPVEAFAVFDEGDGPVLIVGGSFLTAGSTVVNNIARWDGGHWSSLRGGTNGTVRTLTVGDLGDGPALYVGGGFTTAGSLAANRVARWNGVSWATVGSPFGIGVTVNSLVVHDDGSGPALYAGGTYGHVSRWNGTSWNELPNGPDDTVLTLCSFDDGNGPDLYAGGFFLTVDGAPIRGVARWNGASWGPVGGGRNSIVNVLAALDLGGGPRLYAGGAFTGRIARLDGASWTTLGILNSTVRALTLHDEGSGPRLFAGGSFDGGARHVARWNGTSWRALGDGVNGEVDALASHDDGHGARLYAGGYFGEAGDVHTNHFAFWDGVAWSGPEGGLTGSVGDLLVHDDGSGPALFVGGYVTSASGVELNGIGKWDGTGWAGLGSGIPSGQIKVLATHDDGSGSKLFAAGSFTQIGGHPAQSIARWDGATWSALGAGVPGVEAMLSHDDGSGPMLWVGGNFTLAGGAPAFFLARWDGASWSPVPGGGSNNAVLALAAFDDGSGPTLVAGGHFTSIGGMSARRIARWDGTSWSTLGPGFNSSVYALAVHDDGSGPALYAAGAFTRSGSETRNHVARWDGAQWQSVGDGLDELVWVLRSHDDGGGPALFAGGIFLTAEGALVNRIARFRGSWSPLGRGVNGSVTALAPFDDGHGPALFVGGGFSTNFDSGDSFLAKWGIGEIVLDFDTEDDFETPLANGQDVASPAEFGRLVSISSSGPNAGAAIFDSTPGGPNDPSQDLDLLVGRGNVLILQTNANTTQTVPGIFDRPNDDSDGGTLAFQFATPVAPHRLDLVDIDSGANEPSLVILTDQTGRTRTYFVPQGWTGDRLVDGTAGVRTLELTTLAPQPGFLGPATAQETPGFAPDRVRRIEVRLGGSGAVDALSWCPSSAGIALRGPRSSRR